VYLLFPASIVQCRRSGARGGRAFARNLRLRNLLAPPAPAPSPRPEPVPQTVHQASLWLDRQFPWLAGAFVPRPRRGSLPVAPLVVSAKPPPVVS
jgi:hypothetical protein